MAANVQRWLVAACFLFVSFWGTYCFVFGPRRFVFVGLILLLSGGLLFLGLEFLLLYLSYPSNSPDRPSLRELLGTWLQEAKAAACVFLWRQPFCSQDIPDWLPPSDHSSRGLVLVHGLFCNRGLWNPWMHKLRAKNVPFVAVDLEPILGSIDAYVPEIERAVCRVEAATRSAAVLVGHSMGGLAIRAWLGASDRPAGDYRILTIGTPHHGTKLARYSASANGRQMRRGSHWLAELALREGNSDRFAAFTCFWSRCDNVVFPTRSATLSGADNRHLPSTPHVQMAYHPAVFEEALRLVGADDVG